ncbi:DMP19 family protein [Hymenobacter perfusus]|uniref:DUF4375 domain-containing protein n=1 Tax=Hymenobacter perfusus TaxID=1236770 RepID=A0A428KDE9_9BACT|nr:DMP19 family protein [Hymenobacter perfusus]RSK44456.1 DUF4375 domain-containing protein [Hymenobacter perfusus]
MSYWSFIKGWLSRTSGLKSPTLPTIPATVLTQANADDWEYLFVFIDAYTSQAEPDMLVNQLFSFPDDACTLILYSELHGQVTNGGFIQLIQNGYGRLIFDNPLAQDLERWGALQLARIVQEAGVIYHTHKSLLERKRTLAEFSALYKEFQYFDPLETRFYEVMDEQTALIRTYVEQHNAQFAHVVQ